MGAAVNMVLVIAGMVIFAGLMMLMIRIDEREDRESEGEFDVVPLREDVVPLREEAAAAVRSFLAASPVARAVSVVRRRESANGR